MSNNKTIIRPTSIVESQGFTYFGSPCGKMGFVTINKCCSSSIINWCQHTNWLAVNTHLDDNKRKYLVILRDPIDRWISGFSTYLSINNIDVKTIDHKYWKIFKDVVVFDGHTLPQYKHLIPIKLENIIAIDFDRVRDGSLLKIFRTAGYNREIPHLNSSNDNDVKTKIFLRNMIDEDLVFKNRLYKEYEKDYWLQYHLLDKDVPGILLKDMVDLNEKN